ncbi:MAG: hypothetical protein ABIR58_02985 [Gemmatimonadaceae bacterium]
MIGSAVVYSGFVVAFIGLILLVKPIRRLGFRTRRQASVVLIVGILIVASGFLLPAHESRIARETSWLDQFMPIWQFDEFHSIQIAAPPERVYAAVKSVRADEIVLFNTLTWIRRFGRPVPESILNAGSRKSLLDVATQGGFIWLADDTPRELVIGTLIAAPRGARPSLNPATFLNPLPAGYTIAAMNFAVRADGAGGSLVSTETRVYASRTPARRTFAAYWRVIYPGSAMIRRMWLRAIQRRAMARVSATGAIPVSLSARD